MFLMIEFHDAEFYSFADVIGKNALRSKDLPLHRYRHRVAVTDPARSGCFGRIRKLFIKLESGSRKRIRIRFFRRNESGSCFPRIQIRIRFFQRNEFGSGFSEEKIRILSPAFGKSAYLPALHREQCWRPA